MKINIKKLALCAFVVAATAACNKEELKVTESSKVGNEGPSEIALSIDDATRSHLDGLQMIWKNGDTFIILTKEEWMSPTTVPHRYVLKNGYDGSTKGLFALYKSAEGIVDEPAPADGTMYYGICRGPVDSVSIGYYQGGRNPELQNLYLRYKIPNVQNYVENGIEDNILPLYIQGSSLNDLKVYYAGGIIKLQLYADPGEEVSIKNITVSSPNSTVGGYVYANCYAQKIPCAGLYTGGYHNSVTLNCDNGGSGVSLSTDSDNPTVFNIVVPALSLSTLLFSIEDSEGNKMYMSKEELGFYGGGIVRKMPAIKFDKNKKLNTYISINGGEEINLGDLTVASFPDAQTTVDIKATTKEMATSLAELKLLADKLNNKVDVTFDLDLSEFVAKKEDFTEPFPKVNNVGTLILPENAKSFCKSFMNGSTVKYLIFPSTYKVVKNSVLNAFYGTAELPACCTTVEAGNNYHLSAFAVEEGNTSFSVEDGVLFNYDKTSLVLYPANKQDIQYTIPSNVRKVEVYAFQAAKYLEELIVPASVTLMSRPFASVKKLNTITLMGGLNEDGSIVTGLNMICYKMDDKSIYPPKNGQIHCPLGSAEAYKTNGDVTNKTGWQAFSSLLNWTFTECIAVESGPMKN